MLQTPTQLHTVFLWPDTWQVVEPRTDCINPFDQIAGLMLECAIFDAVRAARRGVADDDNEALIWLWDVGVDWSRELGGEEARRQMANICEEIAIVADHASRGEPYQAPGRVGGIIKKLQTWQNNLAGKSRNMTDVT